jgi:hypothetical protein
MMKQIMFWGLCILVFTCLYSRQYASTTPITLEGIHNPSDIKITGNNLIVVDKATLFIYSLNSHRLLKTFGKAGEGPQEFKPYQYTEHAINIGIGPQYIVVGSEKRVTFYSTGGAFIKEKPMADGMAFNWQATGNRWTAMRYSPKGITPHFTYAIFAGDGQKMKEFFSCPIPHYKKDNMVLWSKLSYAAIANFSILDNHIVIADAQDFKFTIYDFDGNRYKTVSREYEKRNLTEADKIAAEAAWQDNPYIKKNWQTLKKIIRIPQRFPAIKQLKAIKNTLWVQTYKKKNNKTEIIRFNIHDNQSRHYFLPLQYKNIIDPYPYTIHNKTLYQVVEDEENETWTLIITGIQPEE